MAWAIAAVVILALLILAWRADRRNDSRARSPDDHTEPERHGHPGTFSGGLRFKQVWATP